MGCPSASLPWQGSREVCRVRFWVLKSGQNMYQILWSAKAVGFALHMGNTMDCVLFSSDTDIGRLDFAASFCALGEVPGQTGWSLYFVRHRAACETPCPGATGKAALKPVEFFVRCPKSSQPTLQVIWRNRAIGLLDELRALPTLARALPEYSAPRSCHQPFSHMGLAGTLHSVRAVVWFLFWVWANRALGGLAKLISGGPESGRCTLCQVPWSEGSPTQFCKWAKLLGAVSVRYCRYKLTLPRSMCCCCQPISFTVRSPVAEPADSPAIPVDWDHSRGSYKVTPSGSHKGKWLSLLLSFPLEELEAQRRPLHMVPCCPGQGAMWWTHSCVSYLLMPSLFISEGISGSSLCSRIPSMVSWSWMVVSWLLL